MKIFYVAGTTLAQANGTKYQLAEGTDCLWDSFPQENIKLYVQREHALKLAQDLANGVNDFRPNTQTLAVIYHVEVPNDLTLSYYSENISSFDDSDEDESRVSPHQTINYFMHDKAQDITIHSAEVIEIGKFDRTSAQQPQNNDNLLSSSYQAIVPRLQEGADQPSSVVATTSSSILPKPVHTALSNTAHKLGDTVSAGVTQVTPALHTGAEVVSSSLSAAQEKVSPVTQSLSSAFDSTRETVTPMLETGLEAVTNTLNTAKATISPVLKSTTELVSDTLSTARDTVIPEPVQESVSSAVHTGAEFAGSALATTMQFGRQANTSLRSSVSNLIWNQTPASEEHARSSETFSSLRNSN